MNHFPDSEKRWHKLRINTAIESHMTSTGRGTSSSCQPDVIYTLYCFPVH